MGQGKLRRFLLAPIPDSNNFFRAASELMQVPARACGHHHLNQLSADDLTTWNRGMAHLTGIRYGGVSLD